MPGPKPGGATPRPMGGFNPGMGAPAEHMDEAAMQAAGQQKQLSQQQSSTQSASGKSGTNPLVSPTDTTQAPQGEGKGASQPEKPREVSGLREELFKRPLADIKKGLASIFDINALFGVNPGDTPEEEAKKKSIHQRFQKLTEEQQQVAQKKYQEEMQKKKLEQEEEERKKQEEEANKKQAIAAPTSTKKGPVGPASGQSKKQKSQNMLEQSRTGLSKSGQKH
ncbi:MAG: hypothetical protein HN846_01860 [Candidatus Pacebacteria bacterium]|jgi:hypothetical protein|nr:hypothetical protein [Candidatus Paceibacterota bacterium]MBT3512008.1 hypothetical protein [Candidatus Paceibacterota bacterium]MBT4004860.1 hypothetical protein [Candidatus Paceibacterota bacterium]MBT4359039.1 hypothetical protein [Candidatus Paceibacterota bacterium]MBT4680526.1 hypothetical protein [Candidatus Paceibacterota bacterium]